MTRHTSTTSDAASGWPISLHEWEFLVRSFESGTLAKARWTHAAHLAVATHYLLHRTARETLDVLRQRIHDLNSHHGVVNSATSGYHETLTVFWVGVLSAYLRAECADIEPLEAVRHVVRRFGEATHWPQALYSFPLLKSSTARERWIAPDAWEGLF